MLEALRKLVTDFGDGGEHPLGAVASPVVSVNRPPDELETVLAGNLPGPGRQIAPGRSPQRRAHADALQPGKRAPRIRPAPIAPAVGVANVSVAVQADHVALSRDPVDQLRVCDGARRDHEEGRGGSEVAQKVEQARGPHGIRPVVEGQRQR